jgi:microcystin-dependent protein
MPSIDDNLELHLALDEIEDGLALDETENDNDGDVNGNPQLLPDEVFGSCFSFDGFDDFVEVNDPFQSADAFTLTVWVRPAAINDGAFHGFVGYQGGGLRKPTLRLAPASGGLSYDSYDTDGAQFAAALDNFFTAASAWVHVAWVKEGTDYRFYRGGELFATRPAPAQFYREPTSKYWVGKVDSFWKGQLAHVRVYSRALSQDEIKEVILYERKEDVPDTNWKVEVKGLQGQSPEWELTTTSKTALAAGEIVQVKLSNLVSSLPSGQTNLYVHYQNLPGYWDGQFVVNAEKSPLVTRDGRVGIGTSTPRSELDTGSGVWTGAANAYHKAQAMMTGGGTVTWGGPGGRLKWTVRFVASSFEVSEALPAGQINIYPPAAAIPAQHVWDGQARPADANGVILYDWEALFAAHRVGGDENAVDLKIVSHAAKPFTAPSNWLLLAAVNKDDMSVRLGTGVTLDMNSSSTNGSPVPVGTIMMWSGEAANVPGGWKLCDGQGGRPNLVNRFVLGAGAGVGVNRQGGQERVALSIAELPSHLHPVTIYADGNHYHEMLFDTGSGGSAGEGRMAKTSGDLQQNSSANYQAPTKYAGQHVHDSHCSPTGGDAAHDNMPPFWTLCYIIKL